MRFIFSFAWILFLSALVGAGQAAEGPHNWERSVVTLDVKRKGYDYTQPWVAPLQNLQKYGVVVGPKEIITSAEGLADRTLLRVQKEGRGKWFSGGVKWIDYNANIALVTVEDETFWKNLLPVRLASPVPVQAPMRILRWRAGKLESRQAEFNQFNVGESKLSFAQYLQLELNSEINEAGWSEPVISDGRLLGLVSLQAGNSVRVIPASFLSMILQAHQKEGYRGLGYFDFVWQSAENPTSLEHLKLTGEPRGVIVIEPGASPLRKTVFKSHDVILQIDGFDIDITGDYNDPDYGHVSLENLATRNKWAGDSVKVKVWREGAELTLDYQIPLVSYQDKAVSDYNFDQAPEYMVVGGLVFQPLSNSYLRSWGADWRRRSPFRLFYYNNEPVTKERPGFVFLAQVLPDPFNIGYQEYRYLVVNQVNGQKVTNLKDLKAALEKPQDGFHVLEFMKSDGLQKMILDAAERDEATQRVLSRYGIAKETVIATP